MKRLSTIHKQRIGESNRLARVGKITLFHGANNPKWNGGCSKYPEHMNYLNMIRRGRMTVGAYKNVAVCERWMESFWNFYEDMGAKPKTGRYTVERINPFGNYEPSNCKWATASEQLTNRRPFNRSEQCKQKISASLMGNRNKALSEVTVSEIVALRNRGLLLKDIATSLGIGYTTAQRYVRMTTNLKEK